MKGEIKGNNQDKNSMQKREGQEVTHSTQAPLPKKEKRKIYFLLSCSTQLGFVLMPYPWIDNDSSIIQDRRGILDVVVVLSFATIGGGRDGDRD